jgi:4-amino-4-deoxy-L-arabinose transferase-like glycosyltransferase
MRIPSLQNLYLQKPVTTIMIIAAISLLPWIGPDDFHTKGEPREASVAVSMLQTGNWALPKVYADEFAYKPPMFHWLVAVASLPAGHVTEWSARLPSALACILLAGSTLFFFGKRIRLQPAFVSAMILVTCFEAHRWGLAARVDMVSATLIVLSLFVLYRWEEYQELKGLPFAIPLLLGCAVLGKGPVGAALPLLVFGVYLLALRKYGVAAAAKALFYAGVSSAFIPLVWYVAAWRQGGSEFISIALAENFGRFLHIENPLLSYELGHRNGLWYQPVMLLAGFLPWSLLVIFSAFGKKYDWGGLFRSSFKNVREKVLGMEKPYLFSLIAALCILVFYSIPSSKRSVYVLPAYPFVALFIAEGMLRISFYRRQVTRVFAGFLGILAATLFILTGMMAAGFDLASAAGPMIGSSARRDIGLLYDWLSSPSIPTIIIYVAGIAALAALIYQMWRKNNIKTLYASIFLAFALNLFIDGVIMRSIRNGSSSRPFAERIMSRYPLNASNTYVMNNPREYRNLYGLNYYMQNSFRNFEKDLPGSGYFLISEGDAPKAIARYESRYRFILLDASGYIPELRQAAQLYEFAARE